MKRKKTADFYKDEYGIEVSGELAIFCYNMDREYELYKKRKQREPEIWNYIEGVTENTKASLLQSAEEEFIKKMDKEKLYKALECLTETQRRRIIAHYFYGISQNKIANVENKQLNAVRDSIKQGLNKLRKYFEIN